MPPGVLALVAVAAVLHASWNVILKGSGDPLATAVRAMVGGRSYTASQFNRATQALRQPGSSFKPFIYSAALEKGFTPATVINDAPLIFDAEQTGNEPWQPKNFDDKFESKNH